MGIPPTRCVSNIGYFAHRNGKGEAKGRSRNKNNSKIVVKNIEGRNVGTIREKSLKQSLTIALRT